MGSRGFRGDTKQAVEGEASANAVAAADNMKTLILVGFLTVAVLCLCQGGELGCRKALLCAAYWGVPRGRSCLPCGSPWAAIS